MGRAEFHGDSPEAPRRLLHKYQFGAVLPDHSAFGIHGAIISPPAY